MACSSVSAWVSAGIVTFLSSVALATGVYRQTGGTVRGTVVDDQGVPVADVSVSFVLQGGLAARFHITTNDNGLFRQLGLPPGTYRMTVGREGYTEQAQDVRVATRETVAVNVVLQAAVLLVSEEERARRERGRRCQRRLRTGCRLVERGTDRGGQRAVRRDAQTGPLPREAHYFLGMAKLNEGLIAEAARELQAYLDREPDGRFAAQATGVLGQIQPDSCR